MFTLGNILKDSAGIFVGTVVVCAGAIVILGGAEVIYDSLVGIKKTIVKA